MNIKYHTINRDGCSIRCKLFYDNLNDVRRAVLFVHGFGGHKETKAAERFAEAAVSKRKGTLVMAFDWPCHGEDARTKLRLADCSEYISLTTQYFAELAGADNVSVCATSFGAYLILKYIAENGNPFHRIALRSPAVNMYQVITQNIMNEENHRDISRGKETLVGFDRKVKIGTEFLQELKTADITKFSYMDFCDDILILHGRKDEIVPIEAVLSFADDNLIECIIFEKADHRFVDQKMMGEAIARMVGFLFET
ncbi:MAG: lysophospholipase [Solobacterium sp.]|nr:lysophospholipase [Solobacterium sp.]